MSLHSNIFFRYFGTSVNVSGRWEESKAMFNYGFMLGVRDGG